MAFGRAVAVLFAREGADVAVVAYLDEHEDAAETKRAVEKEGRRCILIAGDVADPKFCKEAVKKTVDQLGKLDILVNIRPTKGPKDCEVRQRHADEAPGTI